MKIVRIFFFLCSLLLISQNAFAVRDLIIRHPSDNSITRSISRSEVPGYPRLKTDEKIEEDELVECVNCGIFVSQKEAILTTRGYMCKECYDSLN